ncbi:tripartite tricarboxylate transporter substrate binding protein [Mycolicibacterium moriokaense]|nr:tripartite tricarboxylate transporter substrate binding protein [Mycolicibacterium moriokaense]
MPDGIAPPVPQDHETATRRDQLQYLQRSQPMSVKSMRRQALTVGSVTALAVVLAGCGASSGSGADGNAFRRPVDLVVPFGPGGGADQVARAAAASMEDIIDQQIPVVNVPGATGSTGMTKMLAGKPGESMAILIQDTLTTVPAGGASFKLDELQGACRLQSMPSAIMVRKGTYPDWPALAEAAKQKPGQLKVATVGTNSVDDIVLAALKDKLGTSFRAVPYSQPSERYAALLGGGVDVLYEQLGDVRQYLDSGDFVPVVLIADGPVEGYEGVPTAADLGLPKEVVLPQFRGIVVSADTPDKVVQQLSDACGEAVKTPEMTQFQSQVFASSDSYQNAGDFQAFLKDQEALITDQLKSYNIGS